MSISIIGNWKSNGSLDLNKVWVKDFLNSINSSAIQDTAVCPPFIYLEQMIDLTSDIDLSIGSQDIDSSNGARTGSISVDACKDIGCTISIIGHSERRALFHESNLEIRDKLIAAHANNMQVILCIGETEEHHLSGTTNDFLQNQITESLANLELSDRFMIAYEPVWAIGTGDTPQSSEINAIHKFIKDIVQSSSKNNFTPNVIYGGSVSSKNAEVLFNEEHIDGALIGGASLNGKEFAQIANIYKDRGI
jgi:triosephosphate isomerase